MEGSIRIERPCDLCVNTRHIPNSQTQVHLMWTTQDASCSNWIHFIQEERNWEKFTITWEGVLYKTDFVTNWGRGSPITCIKFYAFNFPFSHIDCVKWNRYRWTDGFVNWAWELPQYLGPSCSFDDWRLRIGELRIWDTFLLLTPGACQLHLVGRSSSWKLASENVFQ